MNENSHLFCCSLLVMVKSFVATETQMDVKVELGGDFWFLLSVLYTLPIITPGEMELIFTKYVFTKPVLSNFW